MNKFIGHAALALCIALAVYAALFGVSVKPSSPESELADRAVDFRGWDRPRESGTPVPGLPDTGRKSEDPGFSLWWSVLLVSLAKGMRAAHESSNDRERPDGSTQGENSILNSRIESNVLGTGTTVLPSTGDIFWNDRRDFDGVRWVVVLLIPVYPLGAVHAFDWRDNSYKYFEIRCSATLILRSFVRHVAGPLLAIGAFAIFGAVLMRGSTPEFARISWSMLKFGLALVVPGALIAAGVYASIRRDQRIRRLLGRHEMGSSDPATWLPAAISQLQAPQQLFGAGSFALAAKSLLGVGEVCRAMWAARLSALTEDWRAANDLTDEILRHPASVETISKRSEWGIGLLRREDLFPSSDQNRGSTT